MVEHEVGTILFHILVVLAAAKVAAEIAERVGIPAVVGEICAGIVVGPSVLGLVEGDDVLRTLGELGVVLLLLQVGLEMDLGELGRVGWASVLVAIVGVVCPMLLALPAMQLIGSDFHTSLFVAAALTATSVGITARVFGDLRALATTEARIVLGAAVADDVIGLVVLTVVVRLVTENSVSFAAVGGTVAGAAAFLLVGGAAAVFVAPRLLRVVARASRSPGTLVAIAFAFALAFAWLADRADLAPIVGAFVAGVALARSDQSERVRTELAPVGHLLVPVFFLQVGIDVDVAAFGRVAVLRDAAILLVAAVVGKLLAPLGAVRTRGDKRLIGLGMLPRGEVGLIFAAIGLHSGVLSDDLYAALLAVVLVTTLATPVLLRWRWQQVRRAAVPTAPPSGAEPAGGWLVVRDGTVMLADTPPPHLALQLALEAAVLMTRFRPSSELLDWFARHSSFTWNARAGRAFVTVAREGTGRSWRFLDALGVIEGALPELGEVLHARRGNGLMLDATHLHRWDTIECLRELEHDARVAAVFARLEHPEWLFLAALLVDALDGRPDRVAIARRLCARLDLGARAEEQVAVLVDEPGLFSTMATRPDALAESAVLQLAAHFETAETARAAYLLSAAGDLGRPAWEWQQLAMLHKMVLEVLAAPDLGGREARNILNRRRTKAGVLVEGDARTRVELAPRAYVLAAEPVEIARHASLLARARRRSLPLVEAGPSGVAGTWYVDVVARDRPRLLATVTAALACAGLDVGSALAATWPDGMALESFVVRGAAAPDAERLRALVLEIASREMVTDPVVAAAVDFDQTASPWHTVCVVRAPDRPGLLHAIAAAFASIGVDVHAAQVGVEHGIALDRFEVSLPDGSKLGATEGASVVEALARGVALDRPRRAERPSARRRFHRGQIAVREPTADGNRSRA
jgi:Kef-type K+ transport system membrane component KefB